MSNLAEARDTQTMIRLLQTNPAVFDVLDAGSFVSPKAIPQLRDTAEVFRQLDLAATDTKILAIVANKRGGEDAVLFDEVSYLGFPFYDISTLPMLQGEGLDEFNPIKVDRIAPDDAKSIRSGGAAASLKGIEFNSFGAFFSRKYRENDYLWGRLHGAERLIDIIFSTAPPQAPDVIDRFKFRMLSAILAEEEMQLTAVSDLFPMLRAELAQGPLAKMAAVS